MSKRKLPDTSLAANEAATFEMRKNHWGKIIAAIKVLGAPIYEEIATHMGMDKHAVGRRLKELEGMNIVWKPGGKKLTSKNRMAYQYCLTGESMPKTESQEKILKGKTISDYSKSISKISQEVKQESLFD